MGFNLGYLEVTFIVALLILLFFWPTKFPTMIKSLGQGYREYKKISGEIKDAFSLRNFFR